MEFGPHKEDYTPARAENLDELAAANIPADIDAIKTQTDKMPRIQSGDSSFGGFEPVITLKAAADPAALSVATKFTPNLPAGVTVTKAKLLVKFRDITCVAAANWIATGGVVQIKKAGGAWLTGITLQVNMLQVASGAVGPGDLWIGDIDVKAQIEDGVESEFRLITLRSNADDLLLRDVEFGAQIFFIP